MWRRSDAEQTVHVVARPVEAQLLRGPEPEANANAAGAGPEGLCRLQQGRHPAAVVVHARPGGHRVEMAAGHQHTVRRPGRRLGQHVVAGAPLGHRAHRNPGAGARSQAPGGLGAQHHHRQADPGGAQRGAERLALHVGVGQQHRPGSGSLGIPSLDTEQAAAAAHQRHPALGQAGEVARPAPQPRRPHLPRDAAGAGVGEHAEVPPRPQPPPVRGEPRGPLAKEGKAHRLEPDVEARFAQAGAHVGRRGGVGGSARRPVARRGARPPPATRAGAPPGPRG